MPFVKIVTVLEFLFALVDKDTVVTLMKAIMFLDILLFFGP